jgi:hypothetical protein
MERKHISKSVRFEVLKRDLFTCQYCGGKSPDVFLEIDHITPVAAGGGNDILNLVTACRACNAGKSDRQLSDSTAIDKRRMQLEDLEERRQQLEMLHEWHMSLIDLNDQAVDMAESLWWESVGEPELKWNQQARDEIRKLIKNRGFDAVCNAISEAACAAIRSPLVTQDKMAAINEWFWKISKVASVQKLKTEDPGAARLLYIRGICRKRFHYCNDRQCLLILQDAYELGVGLEWMETTAKRCRNWTEWKSLMDDAIHFQKSLGKEDTDGTGS